MRRSARRRRRALRPPTPQALRSPFETFRREPIPHLAMTIGVEGREGNSVQVYDPANGELKVLDSGNAVFSALAWRKDSSDLAALRSKKDKDFEGESNTVLAWKYLGPKKTIDAPAGKRIVGSRT